MTAPPVTVLGRRTGQPITRVTRADFLAHRWQYRPGQHVSIIAPTQAGKTTLCYELAAVTATPELPAWNLVMKPRDATVKRWARRLGWRRVRSVPLVEPSKWAPRGAASGFVIWPRYQPDLDATDAAMSRIFRDAILRAFRKGHRILIVDELENMVTGSDVNVEKPLRRVWTQGASMGCGLWSATQRPAGVPLHMYSQASHLFLSRDPDARSRKRFGEIGGVDPKLIEDAVDQLREFEWVYIRRDGPRMCIVEAQ